MKKTDWVYHETAKTHLASIKGLKVESVSQKKNIYKSSWTGELSDGRYFMISFFDGMIIGSFSEHEMMLPYDPVTLAVYKPVFDILTEKDEKAKIITAITTCKEIAAVLINVSFVDIMKVLGWKYISKKVEIYEDPVFLIMNR